MLGLCLTRAGCCALLAVGCLWPGLAFGQAAANQAPKVASASLCADQWVLELAAPGQVVGVSAQARGPFSYHRGRAAGLPAIGESTEALLLSGADVVIGEGGLTARTLAALERFGIESITLPWANSFDDMFSAAGQVGAALGRREAAQDWIDKSRRRLAALQAHHPNAEKRPVALYLRSGGGGAAAGTFIDAALNAAGLRNLQALRGQTGWVDAALEDIVALNPDLLVLSYFDEALPSLGQRFDRHPVFLGLRARTAAVTVPPQMWTCAGPGLVEAVERLSAAWGPLMGGEGS